jgi:hypothetical protein
MPHASDPHFSSFSFLCLYLFVFFGLLRAAVKKFFSDSEENVVVIKMMDFNSQQITIWVMVSIKCWKNNQKCWNIMGFFI